MSVKKGKEKEERSWKIEIDGKALIGEAVDYEISLSPSEIKEFNENLARDIKPATELVTKALLLLTKSEVNAVNVTLRKGKSGIEGEIKIEELEFSNSLGKLTVSNAGTEQGRTKKGEKTQ